MRTTSSFHQQVLYFLCLTTKILYLTPNYNGKSSKVKNFISLWTYCGNSRTWKGFFWVTSPFFSFSPSLDPSHCHIHTESISYSLRNWHCGMVPKAATCETGIQYRHQFDSRMLHFWPISLLIVWEKQRKMSQVYGTLHPCETTRWHSYFLAQPWLLCMAN